jgi:hypothetical protein
MKKKKEKKRKRRASEMFKTDEVKVDDDSLKLKKLTAHEAAASC